MNLRPTADARFIIACALLAASFPVLSQTPSLDDVLKRSAEAMERFEHGAPIIGTERCEQKAFESTFEMSNSAYSYRGSMGRDNPRGRREWKADLAIVANSDSGRTGYPWLEFRDVLSVDGRPLPARDRTLAQMLQHAGSSLDAVAAINTASARYNLDIVQWTVHTPAVPLLVLHAANRERFAFEKAGEEPLGKIRAWKVRFRETRAPTLMSAAGGDCASSGTLWIDPSNGDLLRATLQCTQMQHADFYNLVTVTYRRDERLGLRVPAEMEERPEENSGKVWYGQNGKLWVEGKCSYSNFRRLESSAPGRP